MSKMKKRKNREVEPSWGEILNSFKRGVLGSEEDFDDDDFEEVEEIEESQKPSKSASAQKSAPEVTPAAVTSPVQKLASDPTPAPVQIQAPVQEVFPTQKSEEAAEAAIWKTLRADLNRFVQSGEASDFLLQLLEEGFEKNSQLLLQLTELVESRKMEEEVHPGYLMVYQGKQSMFSSKERAFESFFERPGSTIKETIFVSQKRNGKAVSTREATEEEKRRYYEKQSSKVDASGQEGQNN